MTGGPPIPIEEPTGLALKALMANHEGEDNRSCFAMSSIIVEVNGLSGLRCIVEASPAWTIMQVQEAISEKLDVPAEWQLLILRTKQLGREVVLGSLLDEDSVESLQLTLVVEEDDGKLLAAIKRGQREEALALLQEVWVSGLNSADKCRWTALHWAIDCRLPVVALAILAREDFTAVNLKSFTGWTALHHAAQAGYLAVCQAIVERPDFTELRAVNGIGLRAWELARLRPGCEEVMRCLRRAEGDPWA